MASRDLVVALVGLGALLGSYAAAMIYDVSNGDGPDLVLEPVEYPFRIEGSVEMAAPMGEFGVGPAGTCLPPGRSQCALSYAHVRLAIAGLPNPGPNLSFSLLLSNDTSPSPYYVEIASWNGTTPGRIDVNVTADEAANGNTYRFDFRPLHVLSLRVDAPTLNVTNWESGFSDWQNSTLGRSDLGTFMDATRKVLPASLEGSARFGGSSHLWFRQSYGGLNVSFGEYQPQFEGTCAWLVRDFAHATDLERSENFVSVDCAGPGFQLWGSRPLQVGLSAYFGDLEFDDFGGFIVTLEGEVTVAIMDEPGFRPRGVVAFTASF